VSEEIFRSAAPDDAAGEFRRHGTGAVSDGLDLLGINGGLVGLARMSGTGVVVGPAFTVVFEPVEPGQPAPAADFIDTVPPGSVVVIANDGQLHCTVWGDILTAVAQLRGVAGTVIDGCCRDLGGIRELDYPLWSRGSFMKSGKNRVVLAGVQVPAVVCGVLVNPGDLVCADDSGVVVVPAPAAERVAGNVRRVTEIEALVLADVGRGVALGEARRQHGYHELALRLTGGGGTAGSLPAPSTVDAA
jgi:regulator of RNase E activity RraA